jgi:ADP-ribose pyrophosphatase YjhB (NUDIX family)
MTINTYHCQNNCCKIFIKDYQPIPRYFNRNYRKAGVFIYDPKEDRVLLVQSRGHLFGPPKGTLQINELEKNCAIREVKEETGLDISSKHFTRAVKIRNRAIYYYLEMDTCHINVQDNMKDNDANGITWIKIKCLENAINNGNIVLNHYAKIVFYRLMNITFPKSIWTLVQHKKKLKEYKKQVK